MSRFDQCTVWITPDAPQAQQHAAPQSWPELATLAARLAGAWQSGATLDTPPPGQLPTDAAAAFAVQHEILARRGVGIGGWKVGAKSADGPIQGAPLPLDACHASGARFARERYAPLGLELEIAFRFARVFEPRATVYTSDEVLSAIGTMAATVEIVASRFREWPNVDRFAQLADLQNHGALVIGDAVPYRDDFPFEAPALQFHFDNEDVSRATAGKPAANPAGDPRRLLPWVVNHCTQHLRIAVTPDMIVTTGSYTGMFFPTRAGNARGTIEGLPPVHLELF
ncbi:2-keto-4-pentenoate hydratase [Paraburkholderia phosphatilytica]|uniref:2-keto-4-pentenoate hydratase n=1 Tax=Paraburkholderia phosphatilytica TaxID=2282883 RepID=UPI001F0C0F63|nr:2-keto-4-pentenoate hydratase [Paraburkholderia phosphatilytica]